MRVATYSRVSTSDKGQRPQIQVDEMKKYCSSRGWEVKHEIIDHGYSGATDNRPGLKRLLQLVQRREVDIVIVVKLDRLFRSLKHLVTTLDDFHAVGVQFIAIRDAIDFTTPSGRLMVQVLGALAEFEKNLIRERTMAGLDHARRQGKKFGRPKQRDDEAIRKLRTQGLSYREIADHLGTSRGAICRALQSGSKSPKKSSAKSQSNQGEL